MCKPTKLQSSYQKVHFPVNITKALSHDHVIYIYKTRFCMLAEYIFCFLIGTATRHYNGSHVHETEGMHFIFLLYMFLNHVITGVMPTLIGSSGFFWIIFIHLFSYPTLYIPPKLILQFNVRWVGKHVLPKTDNYPYKFYSKSNSLLSFLIGEHWSSTPLLLIIGAFQHKYFKNSHVNYVFFKNNKK